MSYSKSLAIAFTAFVCATAVAVDADAQSRGRPSGGERDPSVGRAVPRSAGPRPQAPRGGSGRVESYRGGERRYDSRGYAPRYYGGRAPLRSYYDPYYGYRPGFSIGLGLGYPYYYGAYGNPYYGGSYGGYYDGYYGSRYGGYYPYGYRYGGGYAVPRGGYDAYGGVRIQGAPRNAEVYVDGAYTGIVDDFDGVFQRLDLEPGSHEVEIRIGGGRPLVYDLNVAPGQTVNIHANVR